MSAKHTPGPWTAVRWSDDEADIYGWSFSAGGHLLPLSDMETDNPDECDANARLIAAAPELLEALRWYVETDEVADMDGNEFWLEGRERARAAITKATGEQA